MGSGSGWGPATLGIMGGSGLYDLPGLVEQREERVTTPWGEPSAPLRFGRLGDTSIVFLPRHGEGHRFTPSEINYRANIAALKLAGVTDLVSFSAVGSYREDLPPGSFVLPHQLIDRTAGRPSSFFGTGCVAHVAFSQPVSPTLSARVAAAARQAGATVHEGGTAVCMEGPQFSTLAESLFYKGLGYDVIGMTSMPEAKLAREAEITYCLVAMVTDYDCWHPHHDEVSVALVIEQVHRNTEAARATVAALAAGFPAERQPCGAGAHKALDGAIITAPAARDPAMIARLRSIAGRVLGD